MKLTDDYITHASVAAKAREAAGRVLRSMNVLSKLREDAPDSSRMLMALQAKNPHGHLYAGTVPAATIAKRRAANKAARRARRAHRTR